MNAILGTRIRSLRESKGYTQEQIAEQMKCTRQKYARIEKGLTDISYASLNIVSQILGVKVEEITSAVNNIPQVQPLYRNNGDNIGDDGFEYINNMIDIFYAHRKLYKSVMQVDDNE